MKLRWKKEMAGEQRGAFIVFTALALWFLMMFLAFSVDFGNYYQHRSRLQNAADAAALAGVAKYTEEEIAANSAGAVAAPTLSKGRLVTLVENDKAVIASRTVRDQAQAYVTNNYGNLEIKENDNKVWSEEVTEEKTENGVKQSTTTTHRYCRVDLVDTIPTFFARIFGVTSLDVKVSALALMDGSAENETWGKRLEGVGDRLAMLAPNEIWETLINTDQNKAFTITDLKDSSKTTTGVGFGEKNKRYYVMTGVAKALLGTEDTRQKREDGNGIIIGYQEPMDGSVCAEPIYLADSISWEMLLSLDDELRAINEANKYQPGNDNYRLCCPTTKVFQIEDGDGVTYTNKGEILALYLNRDHINQRTGLSDRFTKINIGPKPITGKGKNLADDNQSYVVPLYARLESEPIRIQDKAVMPVHGVWINVLTTQTELGMHYNDSKNKIEFKDNVRPFVLAYDGPDPLRGELATGKTDGYDAPWIARQSTDPTKLKELFKVNRDWKYYPAEIRRAFEPLLKINQYKYMGDVGRINGCGVQESATKTSGPIEVNIESGCVFYGVIFAPHSKVTIKGGGIIYGFIAAREIDASGWYPFGGKSVVETETISLPTMSTVVRDRNKSIFDYEKSYITGEYQVAYSYFEDFTKENYYSSAINSY